ncbi:GNAT family N-acetyltransferase [Nocardiopsis lucentensis]|uniref:GNAT family N-acetyltransferase n=1 Tax=Nocardiopsis lucentensis TaxID=53441 RepID=UPI00034AAFC1|nr:GNAT family N-acetyltransferase [Nocardiopsis lucentensis]
MYRLREWRPGDADRLLEAFEDGELARQTVVVPRTRALAREWIARCRDRAAGGRAFAFAVVGGDGPVLGHVEVAVTDPRHDTGWVSYWVHPAERGRGVASAGASLVAEYAFGALSLHRLELTHRVDNPGSCVVALRAGFRPEGVRRARLRYGPERFDVGAHARLATDSAEGVSLPPCGGR